MQKLATYWKSLGWTALMLVLFLIPQDSFKDSPSLPGISEIIHFLMFSLFAVFLLTDTHGGWKAVFPRPARVVRLKPYLIYITVLTCMVLGILIESLQYLMHLGRTAEFKDIILDTAGMVSGIFFVFASIRFRNWKNPKG